MANQRSETKEYIGVYVDAELKADLMKAAKEQGKTLTDLITEFAEAERGKSSKKKKTTR